MKPRNRAHTFAVVVALACAGYAFSSADQTDQAPSRYLFTWVGDEGREDSDFLAVVDLARQGDRYGTIVATAPVGEKGLWPHHTEHELGASRMLFANGFSANRNLLFDLHDPRRPKVVERFDSVGDLSFLHSFARLPNGHVLATFQAHGPDNVSPGGIAEIDNAGDWCDRGPPRTRLPIRRHCVPTVWPWFPRSIAWLSH